MSAAGNRTAREHVLLALFAASLAWALLQSASMLMLLVGAGEDCVLPYGAENWGPPVVAAVVAGLIDIFLVRRAPGFLILPAQVSSLRLWLSLVVTTIIVAAVLFVGPIAVSSLFDPPGPRPDDVQHIPLVFWIGPLAAAALTPIVSVLVAWRWTVRRSSHSGQ